jgi:ammonia channel protein AmtB
MSILIFGFTTSYIFFKLVNKLGRLRVSKFYEVVGIDMVMHTMSDLIGENDDFDRHSRSG